MKPRLVSTRGAAKVAGVPEATIRQWSSRQLLVGYRVHDGRRVRKFYDVRAVLVAEKRAREHGGGSCVNSRNTSQ
jgi:DNA-binding transcriptional MerR regulator